MKQKFGQHLTDTVLMVEPIQFGFNEETFLSNSFQQRPDESEVREVQERALVEFTRFVEQLRSVGIQVIVHRDTSEYFTPDSIFPNNWISTHADGKLFTYPMAVPNRRNERKNRIIEALKSEFGYRHTDLSSWENETPARHLEGTGSMIFDRENNICYAALSGRTHEAALIEFGQMTAFDVVPFRARGKNSEPIYHTNVMLSVGETFVCIGLNTVIEKDRDRLIEQFEATGKTLIGFTNEQIYGDFAGNMLQVRNNRGERILIMSRRINDSLTDAQRSQLDKHNDLLLTIDIPTIESVGGGSVRCMMAEIFKPIK